VEKKAWFPLPWEEIFPGRRTMPIEDFIISVFVWVDDTLKALFGSYKPWRTRGPAPRWEDSEVRTTELVGEFRGYDQNKEIDGVQTVTDIF
jgi:hypothetical protein